MAFPVLGCVRIRAALARVADGLGTTEAQQRNAEHDLYGDDGAVAHLTERDNGKMEVASKTQSVKLSLSQLSFRLT